MAEQVALYGYLVLLAIAGAGLFAALLAIGLGLWSVVLDWRKP